MENFGSFLAAKVTENALTVWKTPQTWYSTE